MRVCTIDKQQNVQSQRIGGSCIFNDMTLDAVLDFGQSSEVENQETEAMKQTHWKASCSMETDQQKNLETLGN